MELLLLLILAGGVAIYLFRKEMEKQQRLRWEDEHERRQFFELLPRFYASTTIDTNPDNWSNVPTDQLQQRAQNLATETGGVTLGDERQPIGARHIVLRRPPTDENEWLSLPVQLPEKLRTRHMYVVGKTGSGKTTLLQHLIKQDLEAGAGLAVIVPEPEMLIEQIIPMIPDHRQDDLIFIDPGDAERPVPFNPLRRARDDALDRTVSEATTIFHRVVGDTTPRMNRIIRNTFLALMEQERATLLDVERLLAPEDPTFRQHICRTTKNQRLRHFFEEVYPTFPKDSHLPITNRLDELLGTELTRRFLCNPDTSLNFRKAMDGGKIMLFNLSDGLFGAPDASLIGQLIISKLQLAAISRADTLSAERKRFYLYIDEFQTFTTVSADAYQTLLSRSRKYEIGLILAHQHTGQIQDSLLKEIVNNVGTIVALRVGADDAPRLARNFLLPTPDKHGLHEEMKTPPPSALIQQPDGMAHASIENHSFRLTCRAPLTTDPHRASALIQRSRQRWGRPIKDPTADLPTNQQADDDDFSHTWDE